MTDFKPKLPARHLLVDNSALYHELRSTIVSPESWEQADVSAKANLATRNNAVKASARIGPEPNANLSDEAMHEWRARVANYVLKLDDLNADILDATFAIWMQRCSTPDAMTVIHASDYFHYRGLRPKGHSYWTEQKREIASRIALLSSTWINLFDAKGYAFTKAERAKLERIDTRVVVVSSVGEGTADDGTPEFCWRIRPGDIFIPMLLSKSGKQLAMLSQKVLEYNYNLFPYEKRAARYFTWLHRIRQSRGEYLNGIRVNSVLAAIRKPIDPDNPIRTKERLERALDRLANDGVIRSWQYQEADEEIVGRKGWADEWGNWCLIVEPAADVIEKYDQISAPPGQQTKPLPEPKPKSRVTINVLVQQMKQRRLAAGLTQLQAAEEIGIAPNYYSMLERGTREPSGTLTEAIERWLEAQR